MEAKTTLYDLFILKTKTKEQRWWARVEAGTTLTQNFKNFLVNQNLHSALVVSGSVVGLLMRIVV